MFFFQFILFLNECVGQQILLNGVVRDNKTALQGVTIIIGNHSILTDKSGEFSISIDRGLYTLVITHTGYKKVEQILEVDSPRYQKLEFNLLPVELLDEVVVLGSRTVTHKSNMHAAVPVDVFSSKLLFQSGQPGLTQMLNYSAPSFNASRELFNEPVALSGLFPDQTLILLNNTRYHNMAYVNVGGIRGQIGKGSVSNDIGSIPFSSIENIEILRDGSSAQYGSDAIAGVINIRLKNSIGKTSLQLHTGQYYKGDGENLTLGFNKGIALKRKGFLNASLDLRLRNGTYRGGTFMGTVYRIIRENATYADSIRIRTEDDSIIHARNFDRNAVSNAGNSRFRQLAVLINGGYPLSMHSELFWTASLNIRRSKYNGVYLLPKFESQLNELIFPNGTKAQPVLNIRDLSIIAGIKGENRKKWQWEYNTSFGSNRNKYMPENTNNPSQIFTLGQNAPTTIHSGTSVYGQLISTISFSKEFSNGNPFKKSNLAYGFEWRLENFRVFSGEEASWFNYDTSGTKVGGVQNTFIFHPDDDINKHRNVLAGYLDLEKEFTKHLLVNLAGRYEYYNDFGGNVAGKLSVRYRLTENFSVRGSVGNGYRAPALQQRFLSTTTYGIASMNGIIVSNSSKIVHNKSEVAKSIGVPSLEAEKSLNLNTGFMATIFNHINLTVDGYWIQIKDRIVQSGGFNRRNNRQMDSILNLLNLDVNRVSFFTNAINTRTIGLDIVLTSNLSLPDATLTIIFGANFSKTSVFGKIKSAGNLTPTTQNTNTLFNRYEKIRIEREQPTNKIILSFKYKTKRLEYLVRNTHFGKTQIANINNPDNLMLDEFFSAKLITDVSISYKWKSWMTIKSGINNLFNVYPDRIKNYENTGEGMFIYGQEGTPFGFNGRCYFVNLSFNLYSKNKRASR